ncbi:hypothetical protein GF371_04530 [Candidatus Woesearchaeota archaeon]|nr:hypothetical protein [Candidatus Woesearchaeota archaeon]
MAGYLSSMAFIIRYAEIGLKGKNRNIFENKLIRNIKKQLPGSIIIKHFGRFYLYNNQSSEDQTIKKLKTVFGIASFSPAVECEPDMQEIKEVVLKFVDDETAKKMIKTFRITVNRIEKKLKSSNELARELGAFVVENTGLNVSLKEFDLNVGVEVSDKIYIYKERMEGLGGLPVGSEGRVFGLLEDKNSATACFLAMKRGCEIMPVVFDEKGIKKMQIFVDNLQDFSPKKLHLECIDERNLKKQAEKNRIRAIIVNDQVDSIREDYNITTLRPLIGIAKNEIKEILELIEQN